MPDEIIHAALADLIGEPFVGLTDDFVSPDHGILAHLFGHESLAPECHVLFDRFDRLVGSATMAIASRELSWPDLAGRLVHAGSVAARRQTPLTQ